MKQLLSVGVIGKSAKENEKRVPVHPEHLERIPPEIRQKLTFEKGYGSDFGVDDDRIAGRTSGRVASREELLHHADCILLPKLLAEDLQEMKTGMVVWGWPHCVQQPDITQVAIEKRHTVIAWEEMFTWGASGEKRMHIFYKNNEIAGYAGVNHALSLMGIVGNYGNVRKAVVFSFGSVSRGAVYALQGGGFMDITVITRRPSTLVADQVPGVKYKQMVFDDTGLAQVQDPDGSSIPLRDALADVQVIVNGTLQNVEHPLIFVPEKDAGFLAKDTLIIDISCDEGMGFWCARPTTFEEPILQFGDIHYYGVDHSPSYYWRSASWEISKALLPYLPIVMQGPDAWKKNKTITRAIDIEQGVIRNQKILDFQKREKAYPHGYEGIA